MGCKQRLLILGTVEEFELRLDGAKPMVGLQRLTRFGKSPRLGCQKFNIGASCLISSIIDSGAFMVGIGHEEVQQLSLLNPRLMGGCEDLSQGRRRRRVLIRLRGIGICPSITSAHHAIIQMTYR
jgi:hypothetical protein